MVSLLHDVQIGSGTHQASYTVSTGGSFTGNENLSKLWLFLCDTIIIFSNSFIFYYSIYIKTKVCLWLC
jgi:hypothetical protein